MYRRNNLKFGMQCIKYILITVCFLFVVTGIIVIILGSTINSIYTDFAPFLEERYFSPSALLVSIGFIIFAVACLGFVGALRESTFMIMLYSFFLLIIFILEVAAGLSAYFLSAQVHDFMTQQMLTIFHDYPTNKEAAMIFDDLQEELHCCGVTSRSDWEFYGPNSLGNTIKYPDSCCARNTTDSCIGYFRIGCLTKLTFVVQESSYLLAAAAITIALMQLVGVLFSFSLGRMLRIQKTRREQRRLLVREQLLNNFEPSITEKKIP